MDQKRNQEEDTTEQSCKVQKVDKGERKRELLSAADLDMNDMDAIMEKLDSKPTPPSWEQLRQRYERLQADLLQKRRKMNRKRNTGKCIYVYIDFEHLRKTKTGSTIK